RLGTSRFRLETGRQTLALSPDGKTLAVVGPDRQQVSLLDPATGRELRRFTAAVSDGLAFLANGKELVCADAGTITFWNHEQGKELRRVTVKAKEATVSAAGLSGDGWLLAVGRASGLSRRAVALFEVQTGRQLTTLEPSASGANATLSLDGKWLAT